jgi:sugar phosphate isomerase/epimerase
MKCCCAGNLQELLCFIRTQFNFPIEIAVSMEDFDGLEAPYCTIAGLNDFLTDVPGLACSFDTGNFIMYQENELEAFQLFRDKICTVHLKDRRKVS